ncbi:MAG: hypothetical protein V3U20_04210 [Thermoplasmata archaeon]
MVVICPDCGREIYSDPDSCVICGWRRDAPQSSGGKGRRGTRQGMGTGTQRPLPSRAPTRRSEGRQRGAPMREPDYRTPPSRDYPQRARTQYRREDDRNYQRMPRREPQMVRGYPENYRQRPQTAYPQRRDQRPYPEERREPPYQGRVAREGPRPRYGYEVKREPAQDLRERGYGETGRNYCPNCGREILTDPDNCVICGWSRDTPERRPRIDEQRRTYPREQTQRYQQRAYQERGGQEYRRESERRAPPEGWESHIEQRMRGEVPAQMEDRRAWYKPETEARVPIKAARDRFVCENCQNPSLQFFADGLGRCPACGYRFRFSARSPTIRSKQKHKQFICSNCDNKNLQFFLDGRGLCPSCKREFRWRK